VEPPLRILIVTAQQPAHGHLDLASELVSLSTALRSNPSIEIQVLEQADSGALRRALVQKAFHVLHYMGHGAFEAVTGEGAVLFSRVDGMVEAVSGRHLSTKIKDFASLRLVVLNACSTALTDAEGTANPFGGVATALVLGGVPAVVAMQAPIADHYAVAFSTAFYNHLSRGMPLEEAVTEGRQAIHSLSPESADWAIPILFQRNTSEMLLPLFADHAILPSRVSRGLRLRIFAGASALLLIAALAKLPQLVGGRAFLPISQSTAAPTPAAVSIEQNRENHRSEFRRESASGLSSQLPRDEVVSQTPKSIATGGLRIEVSGAPLAGLANAVRRAAGTIAATGWTLRLNVSTPQTEPYNESGLAWISCSLTTAASVEGHGASADLGTISAVRSKANGGAACDAASEELAGEVARKLQFYLKEKSK
jgi:hypothetical protein